MQTKTSPPRRATIKDVARAANVSAMTVSNVLNKRLQFVSQETRARVEREIARLNYRRQAAARNLRVSEQRSIGMVILDELPAFLADLFTCQVVAGLANLLNHADYTLTIQGMTCDQLATSMIMRNYEVGGFCAMISGTPDERRQVIDRLQALDQPLIVFQQEISPQQADVCSIRQDDRGGGRLIGDHLMARGCRDVWFVMPRRGWPAVENRQIGLRQSLAAGGGTARLTIVKSASELQADVQAAVAARMQAGPRPDAIVGANDQIALAAMHLLQDRGIATPDDVRIVGFNAFEAHRDLRPHLTTVASPAYVLGEKAGEAMLRRLSDGFFADPDLVLPVRFTPGETT